MRKKETKIITDEKLINYARDALTCSYSPHSKFMVGAALLTDDGKIFKGTNIEFDSYSLTVCAERTALFNAVSAGYRKFRKIAIVVSSSEIKYPCGLCRQALAEFNPDLTVLLTEGKKVYKVNLRKLIPHTFRLKKIK